MSAASTSLGRSSAAGAWSLWKDAGTPSGRITQSASVAMSMLRRSETGPSSSTFHRADRSVHPRIKDWVDPLTVLWHVKTQGSECDWVKPHPASHGNRDRCQRRPACAMPYTGLTTRQTR
eukprot:842794-Pleurochrysis_carterae.AAC.1